MDFAKVKVRRAFERGQALTLGVHGRGRVPGTGPTRLTASLYVPLYYLRPPFEDRYDRVILITILQMHGTCLWRMWLRKESKFEFIYRVFPIYKVRFVSHAILVVFSTRLPDGRPE